MNNNKNSKTNKVKSWQDGLNYAISTKRKRMFSIHQGAQVLVSLFGLLSLGLLTSQCFFSHSAYAASYVDVSSNGDGTSGSGIVRLGRISPSSTGTQATGSDTLTIHTDCAAGYKVYVSSQENQSTSLVNSNAATPENPSAKDLITAASNVLGENVSSAPLSSNTWGINGDSTEAGNGLYYGLPSFENSTTFPLITMSNVAEESTVPIYYGVKVDTSINPGTYSGSVLYTVLINNSCLDYTVVFNPNVDSSSSSEITGTMSDQSIMYGETTALSPNAYTRTNYNFLGWSTSSTGKTGTVVNGVGTTADVDYENEADVLNLVSGGGIVTLYAIWEKEVSYFQTTDICSTLPADDTSILRDNRDNQDYTVYRWGSSAPSGMSNYCIMTKDLSLGYVTGGSVTKDADLTLTTDTSAVAGTITARPNGSGWSTTNSDDNLQYMNGPQSGLEAYSSHSYYSYGAAQKVCPKGWRLPTRAEYNNIATFMSGSSSTITSNPYNFVSGGHYSAGGWRTVSSYGYYWSSTQYNSPYGYYLRFDSSRLSTNYYDKYTGFSVRCIMEIPTMQNTACSSLPEGQTSTLPDARDNQDYTIYRWPTSSGPSGMNGYCIMTKDLSLGYVTGGSTTAGGNLSLTTDSSAAAGTIEAKTSINNWSTTDSSDNLQYINGPQSGKEAYSSHSYYSYGAARKVCPKGWRLPTQAEYNNIASFMGGNSSTGSSNIRNAPYNFVYGGYFNSYGWYYVGSYGFYWSSSQDYISGGGSLSISSSYLGTDTNYSMNYGLSVRCISN